MRRMPNVRPETPAVTSGIALQHRAETDSHADLGMRATVIVE